MSTTSLARRVRPAQPFGAGILDDPDPVLHVLIDAFAPPIEPVTIQPPAPLRSGPSMDDLHFEAGRCAILEAGRMVEAPAGLSSLDRLSFLLGIAAGATEYHERELRRVEESASRAGIDDEPSHDPMEYAEVGVRSPYREYRD